MESKDIALGVMEGSQWKMRNKTDSLIYHLGITLIYSKESSYFIFWIS